MNSWTHELINSWTHKLINSSCSHQDSLTAPSWPSLFRWWFCWWGRWRLSACRSASIPTLRRRRCRLRVLIPGPTLPRWSRPLRRPSKLRWTARRAWAICPAPAPTTGARPSTRFSRWERTWTSLLWTCRTASAWPRRSCRAKWRVWVWSCGSAIPASWC